ncbi:MAG: lysophospholipid acyltransferase family protein [Pseudomonadota bacterium]
MSEAAPLNLPAPRSAHVTLQFRLEAMLFHAAMGVFSALGPDRASALGGWIGRHIGTRLRGVTKRGVHNLKAAFPEKSDTEINAIVADVWENLGRTAAEYAHLDAFHPFEDGGRVAVEGAERLRQICASGKPAVFVTAHYANWEVMAIMLSRSGLKFGFVYRAANNPLVDREIIERRNAVTTAVQIPKGKRGGRALLEVMRKGHSIAMLVDQKLNDGIRVPFMGRDAMTPPAAARMALKFNAPVIPLAIERVKGATFVAKVKDPIPFEPTGDRNEDIRLLTTKVNEALEDQIRSRPGEWLWLHRRWPRD